INVVLHILFCQDRYTTGDLPNERDSLHGLDTGYVGGECFFVLPPHKGGGRYAEKVRQRGQLLISNIFYIPAFPSLHRRFGDAYGVRYLCQREAKLFSSSS